MSRTTRFVGPRGGLYVVESEVCLLMTAMRRGARWSSHSHQDDDQDALIKGLNTLKEAMNEPRDLSQLKPGVFLAPFLEIIRSEETTGPVTSLALSAVSKIISYGLVDSNHPAIASCVEAIADAVTHARFVGTDASGDGVVLMRILQVLRALMLSPAGDHLSNESICEIMLSCFRICFETRLSEILRRTAEHCLRDMVQHLFTRLPQFIDDTRALPNMKKMRTNSIDNTRSKNRKHKSYMKQKSKSAADDVDVDKDPHILSSVDGIRANDHLASTPVSPVGNIVDMQGSLDHGVAEKNEDEKNDGKVNSGKDTGGKNECGKAEDNQEVSKKQEDDKDGSNGEVSGELETAEAKSTAENVDAENNKDVPREETKSPEKEDASEQRSTANDTSESSVKQTVSESQGDEDKSIDLTQSPAGSVEDLSMDESASKTYKAKEPEQMEEYVNTQGVRFMPLQQRAPYGALCVRELFRFLVSLCNPLDKQNNEIMTHLGLSLLQVALEIAADALSNFSSLLALIKDDLCRNLILLLGTDRLSILAVDLQVSFLLFESQREHLKFQLEHYLTKLMEIVNSESNKISYEQRELALEAVVRLWRIAGLPAELYLNYDCGLYSTNLYEELMKMFSKNVSIPTAGMYSVQLISLDAILMLVAGMEIRCKDKSYKPSRHQASPNLPTREVLLATKSNKRWLVLGTEKFNENPREGIAKLTEHGLLGGTPGHSDPEKIAKLLRENPGLDKKAIGEYISKKENKNILNYFVHNFDLRSTRIDQALRLYLESFRLPGEAPLISLLLEKFAEHWHDSNGRPFASADAAFTLAYAVIMLNVDQHNYNVKRQNNPMTADEFKKNLKAVNGGADFDQDMLDEIYTSIKGEEIVMPAEQTGLVKDNYLWKVLLRRGFGPESTYLKIGNSGEFIDRDLAEHAWGPIVSALCRAYDRAPDRLRSKVSKTFLSCAAISAHYSMCSNLDTLVVSLCKFTGLITGGKPEQVVQHLGGSDKCQQAASTLFEITHSHGDAFRASWKNIIDCLQSLYEARLLPENLTEAEDFIDPSGKISLFREPTTPKVSPGDQGILSTFYSYIAMDTSRQSHPAEVTARKKATEFIAKNCHLKLIIKGSKYFQSESLNSLVGALVSVNPNDEDVSIFLLELLLEVSVQNRDRVACIWPVVQSYLDRLLTVAARENHPYLLERVAVGILRLAIRLLRSEEFACLSPLLPLTQLPSATTAPLARQIAYGLFELLKIGAANIHSAEDWKVVFSLLECAGAGALAPKRSNTVLDETANARASVLDPRPISPVPEWVLVSPTGTEAPLPVAAERIVLARDLQPHDSAAFVKCCESLNFLVCNRGHITPFNFDLCVNCARTFAEAVLQCAGKRHRVCNSAEETPGYQHSPEQLLDLMHALHTGIAEVFRLWAGDVTIDEGISLWPQAWRPLLQGIARLCCDARRSVRIAAIDCLQKTLMVHDSANSLAQLSAIEWSQCFEEVFFPLLAQLLDPIAVNDPIGVAETRSRAARLLQKVFLHHLTPLLTLPGFLPLWLTVLDLMRAYMHADNSELLFDAIPEFLKNMLLVMSSTNVLAPSSNLWAPTWRAIDAFLPNLRTELFPEPPAVPHPAQQQQQQQQAQTQPQTSQVISLVGQQHPLSFPGSIAPQPESTVTSPTDVERANVQDNASAGTTTAPVDILHSAQPAIPIPLPSLVFNTEGKEPQQVITLVSQPAPSVSSPVAVQPAAQSIFDVYHSANLSADKASERQQSTQPTQLQLAPSLPSEEELERPVKGVVLTSSDEDHGKIAMRPYEWKQQQCTQHATYEPVTQYKHLSPENSSYRTDPSETMSVDSTAATMFNSAAYFSEDPAADRLFVVTNP